MQIPVEIGHLAEISHAKDGQVVLMDIVISGMDANEHGIEVTPH